MRQVHLTEYVPKRIRRLAECEGKEPMTGAEAQKRAELMRRRHSSARRRISAYRCRFCGKFHIGGDYVGRRRTETES